MSHTCIVVARIRTCIMRVSQSTSCWDADTPDFEGRGETVPVPYFFQNLAEAEYVVTLYQYMRLLGYPAEKISMLTTYNGQKALLKDVVERRCAHHPAFGVPHKVSLVTDAQTSEHTWALLCRILHLTYSSCAPSCFAQKCCATRVYGYMNKFVPCCDL